jgi:hypothetical protein
VSKMGYLVSATVVHLLVLFAQLVDLEFEINTDMNSHDCDTPVAISVNANVSEKCDAFILRPKSLS